MTSVAEMGTLRKPSSTKRAGDQRRRKALADAGDGVERARGELAEQGGALQQALQLGEDGVERDGDFGAAGGVVTSAARRGGARGARDQAGDEPCRRARHGARP